MERTGRSQKSTAQDNPDAAAKLIRAILSSIENLTEFPKIGASLSSKIKIKTDYRYLVCSNYLIIYKAEGDFVSVYRVLNGMRNYLSIIFADEFQKD